MLVLVFWDVKCIFILSNAVLTVCSILLIFVTPSIPSEILEVFLLFLNLSSKLILVCRGCCFHYTRFFVFVRFLLVLQFWRMLLISVTSVQLRCRGVKQKIQYFKVTPLRRRYDTTFRKQHSLQIVTLVSNKILNNIVL